MKIILFAITTFILFTNNSFSSAKKDFPVIVTYINIKQNLKQELLESFKKLKSSYPFELTEKSVTGTKTNPNVFSTNRIIEFADSNKIHSKFTSSQASRNGEFILYNDFLYIFEKGKWIKRKKDPNLQNVNTEEVMEKGISDVKYIGEQKINNIITKVYSYKIKIKSLQSDLIGKGTSWIGKNDGLPHKVVFEGDTGAYKMRTEMDYNYKAKFKVVPPVK